MFEQNPTTPLTEINHPLTSHYNVKFFIKREDLIHPHISGNKWYKLKYNLIEARKLGYKILLTFGGAYSNHIYATASAGKEFGFETIGVIRGEEHLPLNPTLSFAQSCGMQFFYLDRLSYRDKYNEKIIDNLKNKFGDFYLIPEGGSNKLAVKGCSEIISGIKIPFDFICTASGTGGTLAGLTAGLNSNSKAIGFSVLKGGEFLKDNVIKLLSEAGRENSSNWEVITDYHFGGYAKSDEELNYFCEEFREKYDIEIEPIYTGKMLWGVLDLIQKKYFPENSTIIALHSGGLQGLNGLRERGKY